MEYLILIAMCIAAFIISKLSDKSSKQDKQKENKSQLSEQKTKNETLPKTLNGVENLKVEGDNGKYALIYKGRRKTDYIYDNVEAMSEFHARLTQKQSDGSFLYGVATTASEFHKTECEYKFVTWYYEYCLLVVDEDNEEYVIDRWGELMNIDNFINEYLSE